MSRQHVPDALMQQFVDAEVDEKVAVAVALHLDACPSCATRAAALEPLAPVLAAVDDPVVPVGLVESITVAVKSAERPGPEPAVAAGLMGLAVALFVLGGDPTQILARGAVMASALATVVGALFSSNAVLAPAVVASACIAMVAAILVARNMEPRMGGGRFA